MKIASNLRLKRSSAEVSSDDSEDSQQGNVDLKAEETVDENDSDFIS